MFPADFQVYSPDSAINNNILARESYSISAGLQLPNSMDATFADEICHANHHSRSSNNTTRANDSSNSCGHQKETLGMLDTTDLAQPRQHKKQGARNHPS